MTRKQEIYIRIMEEVLPYLRNLQRHSESQRMRYGTFYSELELVHNLARCLVLPQFVEADAYWLRAQGLAYIKNGRRDLPFYDTVCALLTEIATIMPEELKRSG